MKAIDVLEKEQPNNPVVFNLRGGVYLSKNDVANARRSFEQALALDAKSTVASFNLAQLDLLENNAPAARQRFQRILEKDSTNVQAMIGLAGVAAANGEEAETVSWFEKAVKAGPSAALPRVLLANHYLRKNDSRRALAAIQEAFVANPNNSQVLDVLGTAQLAAGETQNAVATYGRLADLNPKNPIAYYQLAAAQAANQNIAAAVPALNKALALKPDYLQAQLMLAYAESDAGHYGAALKIAEQIQKQDPKSASGLALQGDILMAQKRFTAAQKIYEQALEVNKSGALAIKLHQALSAGGNAQEAEARLLRWLQERPNDLEVRAYLAATYLRAGHNKQAIEQYQLVLEKDPKKTAALNDLAWLYQQEKDPRALIAAEQAYSLKPDDPHIMDTLGWILAEKGETTRALDLLQKAADKTPASAAIRYHLAATLAQSGDTARARRELGDLLAKNKNFPQREEAQALLKRL